MFSEDDDDFTSSPSSSYDDNSDSDMTIDLADSDYVDNSNDDNSEDEPMDELNRPNSDNVFGSNDNVTQESLSAEMNPSNNSGVNIVNTMSTLPASNHETQRLGSNEASLNEERRQLPTISSTQVESENNCLICTDLWTNSEKHHLVSLKCGHLFGKSCIEAWLAQTGRNSRCPQCNKPAKKKDILKIYSRLVKPLDTLEKDEALAKVKVLEEKVKTLTTKLEAQKTKNKMLEKGNDDLKCQLMNLSAKMNKSSLTINATIKGNIFNKGPSFLMAHLKDLNIKEGACRLHSYSNLQEALVISVTSSKRNNQSRFPEYGFKKLPLSNSNADFTYIHNKPIKDMVINQYDATIATVSTDKTLKITSLISKTAMASVNLSMEPWSVHLNASTPNLLYTGLRNGDVMIFDKRMLNTNFLTLSSCSKSPVVSLTSIGYTENGQKQTALMSVQLDTCTLYRTANPNELSQSNYHGFKLPIEGRYTSSHYDPKSGLSLLSCRPSQNHKKVTHYVFDLEWDDENSLLSPNVVTVLEGGTEHVHLSRSKIYSNSMNEDCVLTCAGDESTNGALVWDSKSSHLQKIVTGQPVLDIELIEYQQYANTPIISCLSENIIKLYKLC